MESIVKKYQQRFRKVKEEMEKWNELQSRLISQFANASSIIQRLQILQDSKNYGVLRCVEGVQEAVLLKQINSLQTILLSMNETLEKFHSVVLSLEKMVRDGRHLVKGGSVQITVKQLQQRVGIKPRIADCLDGLNLLSEMHQSEYRLKLSVISAISAVALKPRGSSKRIIDNSQGQLGLIQLVNQKEEISTKYDSFKIHSILYTNGNYMGAPKENKGLETTTQLRKLISSRSKALLFFAF